MSQYRQDLSDFFRDHCRELCLTGFLLVLSLYSFLFSDNYRMDTIIKQVYRGDEFNDLELGRFGIVWFNRLFGMRVHNPYFSAFLTVLTILLSSFFLSFMLWKASNGRSGRLGSFLPLIVYLTPNWIEQMYFSYQIFLVVFGVLLVELAVFLTEYCKEKRVFLLSVLLTFCAFSIYQAFVPLYLTLCIGLVLVRYLNDGTRSAVFPEKSGLRHAVVFFAALAGYYLVNFLVQRGIEGTAYLSSQIHWGVEPLSGILRNIAFSLKAILTADGEIDTISYSVSALCCLILFILRLPHFESRRVFVISALGWLGLQLTAFAMLLILGSRGYIRTELSLPFVTALNFLIAFFLAKEISFVFELPSLLVIAACVICLYISAGICFRLIYTDDVRYANDVRLAAKVISRLEDAGVNNGTKPVVFVGTPEVKLDASCINGEVIGRSLFQFLTDEDLTFTVMTDFLATQGFNSIRPMPTNLIEANKVSQDMPDFPAEGSVKETERIVVVRFSEDYYYDLHVLKPGIKLSDEPLEYRDGMICQMQRAATDGLKIRLQGFNFRRGTDAREIVNTVYLLNQTDGKLYRVNTARKQNMLLTRMYWRDGIQYDGAGFAAELPISLFVQYPDDNFEILVRFEEGGENYFVSTGENINKKMIDKMHLSMFEEWQRQK